MATFRVRIELPDRPGALGAVASRIGAVRGDVVSVEILGRGGGVAVDEFVVELDDADHLPLLLVEIAEVDGVAVQTVQPVSATLTDQRVDAYHTAAALLGERTPSGVLAALAARTRDELDAAWAAIVDGENHMVIAAAGTPPAPPWLDRAARQGEEGRGAADDLAWVHLPAWDLTLMVGRPTWPFGARDRGRLAALAHLADARWEDLRERDARVSHPSHGALA